MSGKPDDGWFEGDFESLGGRHEAPVTDCSNWEPDIPADQWTVGEFVNLAGSHMTPVTDCSEWDRVPPVWLELRVHPDPGAAVGDVTAALVRAAAAAAPELGLAHDPARSRVDGGDVVVALTPAHPAGARERLPDLIRAARAAAIAPAVLADVRLFPAA